MAEEQYSSALALPILVHMVCTAYNNSWRRQNP